MAFNYYYESRTCERYFNYSPIYRAIENNASQMCILQLPHSQRADIMSCSINNSVWNPNGITVAGFDGELAGPYAVIFSNDYSFMFVADSYHNRILQYDLNLSTYTMIYDGTDIGLPLDAPLALALADDGSELIIASYMDKRVWRWSFITNSSSLATASYYSGVTGVAIDKNKTVYISEQISNYVSTFAVGADPYWGLGEWYIQSNGPKHMVIVNDTLYVVECASCRVIKVSLTDPNQTIVVVAGNGRLGSTSDRLRFPWGVAVDRMEGHIFVGDSRNHRIQLWLVNAMEGITIAGVTARPGTRANQLDHPHGLALGDDRSIFVADTNNGRIQKFQRYCLI